MVKGAVTALDGHRSFVIGAVGLGAPPAYPFRQVPKIDIHPPRYDKTRRQVYQAPAMAFPGPIKQRFTLQLTN